MYAEKTLLTKENEKTECSYDVFKTNLPNLMYSFGFQKSSVLNGKIIHNLTQNENKTILKLTDEFSREIKKLLKSGYIRSLREKYFSKNVCEISKETS